MDANYIIPLVIVIVGGLNWGVALWWANRSYRRRKRNINK